jgi:peptide/nickel transport system substrate-binding protein
MVRTRPALLQRLTIFLLACTVGLVAGCSGGGASTGGTAPQGPPQKGGTLAIALNAEPATLDWSTTTAVVTRAVAWNIFEQLFAYDKGYKVKPMLATGYKVSADKLSYTITLRDGVKFHDGTTMGPADVIASIKRWGEASRTGANVVTHIAGMTAQGGNAVVIKLKDPFTPLIASLAEVRQAAVVMPAKIANAAGKNKLSNAQLIGTGPYKFVNWAPGQNVTLERFADYSSRSEDWGGLTGAKHAYLDKLEYDFVKDSQVRLNGVQTGQFQFAVNVPQDLYDQVKSIDTVQPFIVKPYAWQAFVFNKAAAPFSDVRLRQAVEYASNLQELASAGVGNKAFYTIDPSVFFPESSLHSEQGTEQYNKQDVAKAKELLAAAHYDGKPIRILTTKDYPEFYNGAVALASQLNAVGFKTDIQVYDWATVLQRRDDKTAYEIFTTTNSPSFDPTSTDWMVPQASPGFYTSPKMDGLLKQWSVASADATKQKLLAEFNQTVYSEVPLIKGAVLSALYVGGKSLQGYPNWLDTTFWNAWMSTGG